MPAVKLKVDQICKIHCQITEHEDLLYDSCPDIPELDEEHGSFQSSSDIKNSQKVIAHASGLSPNCQFSLKKKNNLKFKKIQVDSCLNAKGFQQNKVHFSSNNDETKNISISLGSLRRNSIQNKGQNTQKKPLLIENPKDSPKNSKPLNFLEFLVHEKKNSCLKNNRQALKERRSLKIANCDPSNLIQRIREQTLSCKQTNFNVKHLNFSSSLTANTVECFSSRQNNNLSNISERSVHKTSSEPILSATRINNGYAKTKDRKRQRIKIKGQAEIREITMR